MRHRKTGRKFGRKLGDKRAFLKSLAHNLIMKEKITTTQARAKELKRVFDPLVSLARKQTLASYRLLLAKLPKKSAEKLFKDIGTRYRERKSGYTRIFKLNRRKRDAAPMAVISLVETKPEVKS